MSRVGRVFVVLSLVFVGSCSRAEGVLERGGPRLPDVAGVVTDATLANIQLDGRRRYEIAERVESFLTRSHRIASLLSWEGKYVHIGLEDGKVAWIAGIGVVLKTTPPTVFYSGVFDRFERSRRRAYFEDGTVLGLDRRTRVPPTGAEVLCEIDAQRDLVTRTKW